MAKVIIIGGGPAGCEAAHQLASQGIDVELVEKNNETGGNLNNWYQLFPDRKSAKDLNDILKQNLNHPKIQLHLGMEPRKIEKNKEGRFLVPLSDGSLLEGDSLLVSTGFKIFDARRNHSIRMANGNTPKRIGIIHCVGSRDEKVCNYHCSKLCCITGVKQAIELRELLPDTEIFCFYMDMRMFGPGYEEMYRDAQEKYNIKFVRGRLSEAAENMNKQLQIKVEDTLVGKPLRMTLDMMILLVGMESSEGSRQMADTLGLNLAPNGFIKSQDPHYRNNNTNVEGVFVAGCGSAPMNLTDTLADARSAAMNIIEYVKLKKIL